MGTRQFQCKEDGRQQARVVPVPDSGSQKAGTFGCKFDANANATEGGAATVNSATGEIDLVVAKERSPVLAKQS
jgi:hypothetical protein